MHKLFRIVPTALAVVLCLLMALAACKGKKDSSSGGVKPADALSTFTIADGFKLELIAAEPLLSSPVDMEIDEYGRMYVVEMHGYPLDKSGTGNIIQLSDTDGDGKMDKRTVFKEGLMLPNSILRWKKGFMIADSPHMLYLEDTDNDGKADVVDTLITGFALTNPQHNLNNPVYGLDNWVYVAHEGVVKTRDYMEEFGDEGTEIFYPGRPNAARLPQNANGRSIRFRPDRDALEMTASRSQFGHSFDEWGHWFGCNNSNQGYHEVIPNRYFVRNPDLLMSEATQSMSDHLNAAEVFPTTKNPDRQLLTNVGVMTSACGLTTYLGDAFPAPFNKGITFIAEPVSNLVHVDVLKDSGASFVASRVLENKEFLSSTDAWSRPVNLYVGPDGALYVLDYYRRVIESPEWMSEQVIAAGGLYDGVEQGRIYRITPTNGKAAEWMKGLRLGDAGSTDLVKQLANSNGWWRINAQRLLVDRNDAAVVPALEQMAATNASAMARLHALWTLEGMSALTPDLIEHALRDSIAGIRENAIKLAELHLSDAPLLVNTLLKLQTDPDAKVRLQLLLTLGFVNTPGATEARNALLFTDLKDKWVQVAALSAPAAQNANLLQVVLDRFDEREPAYASLVQRLTTMIGGSAKDDIVRQLIRTSTTKQANGNKSWQSAIIGGLAQGLKNRKSTLVLNGTDQEGLINAFFQNPSAKYRQACFQLLQATGIPDTTRKATAIAKAAVITADTSLTDEQRADAIDFLSLGDVQPQVPLLQRLLVPREQPMVQLAALRTLSSVPGMAVSEYLVQQWPLLTNEIREAAIGVLITNPQRIALLIDALEKGKINTSSVSFNRSVQLMQVADEGLRKRTRTIFTKSSEQAKEVNKAYQASLDMDGDPGKGKAVYVQNCAVCHQVRGKMGVALGPDLGTIHNWKKEDILANILDPNLSIYPGFDLWDVSLNNGENVQGIIASETATALTLRNNGKLDRIINRQDVRSLKSLSISAMPSGLEKNIDKQQMADILAFLRQNQ